MAYTVKYHGYDVACDTAEDLRMLLNENGNKPLKTAVQSSNGSVEHGETTTVVSGLVAKLRDEQRQVLRIIAKGTISRQDLREAVGVTDPHEFAGLLIGISKSAAGSGIESPIKKLTERVNGRGPRVYKYKTRDDVKAEVKAALAQ